MAIYEVKNDGNDFIFKDFNPAAEKLERVKKEELIGKSVLEVFPGVKKLGLLEVFARVWKTGKSEVYPVALYEHDKLSSWRENYVYKLPNGNIVAIYNDVTELKKLNEEFRKQKIFFEQMFMQSSTSTQILDKDGWCERINHKLSELFCVLPEDIEGKKYNIFNDGELKKKGIIPYLEQAFDKGEAVEWEMLFDIGNAAESQNIKVSEKKERWFYNKAYPLFDENNQLTHVIIQHIDITERKKTEEELKNKEAQLSNALKVGLLGSWEYDFIKDVFTFSDSFYALLHTTVEKIGGYTMSSADYAKRFVYPEDAALVGAEIKKSVETTDPNYVCRLEHRIIYADGKIGHIKVLFSIIKDNQGRTVKSYGVNQNITERKKAEIAMQEKNQESEKFNSFAIDRELKMIELKKEINELMKRVGEKPKYIVESVESDESK